MSERTSGPLLSIVVPVYNEGKRIPKNIGKIFSYVEQCPLSVEIIFVNDGSQDETQTLLEEQSKKHACGVVTYAPNRGKGYAVRRGVFAARGDFILFFDIDLATPLEMIDRILPSIQEGTHPIIIGNRRLSGASIANSESLLRTFLGNGYMLLSRLFVPEVTDFTCGFKCFRKDAAKRIFSHARIDRWAFDTEILYLARYFNFSITQIPVNWTHDTDSRVRVFRDVARSLYELGLIVMYTLTGAYRKPCKADTYV